jgi:hypothetical protein
MHLPTWLLAEADMGAVANMAAAAIAIAAPVVLFAVFMFVVSSFRFNFGSNSR